MLPLTQRVIAELDVLYGLYLLALDQSRQLEPEDEDSITRVLETRDKVLERTAASAAEASKLLKALETERNVPANETALVEEKRRMILDVVGRLQLADSQMLRGMHASLSALRRELARHVERKDAIKAYITAPAG
jgi:hypothetical protein